MHLLFEEEDSSTKPGARRFSFKWLEYDGEEEEGDVMKVGLQFREREEGNHGFERHSEGGQPD